MKVLFIGNSLTNGSIGVSFVNLIKSDHPGWHIINAGVNGDTLVNIGERLPEHLRRENNYDHIVIEGGYNDIILPLFLHKSLAFRLAFKYLARKGRRPIKNPETFEEEYLKIIAAIKALTKASIVLVTLGCINEHLSSESNYKRNLYNEKIKRVAVSTECSVADVGEVFDSVLHHTNQTDFFLKSFGQVVYLDRKIYNTEQLADKLSHKRKLSLTIDGVHLNTQGADIFRQVISKALIPEKTYNS